MPILHIHSKQDKNVPYSGGIGSRSSKKQWNPSVDSTLAVFIKLAQCSDWKPTIRNTALYTFSEWATCPDDVSIQYYPANDGGHSWPGGNKSIRMLGDPPSEAIVNNDVSWNFFKSHPLP
jgi:polyhydroxybutyrate depolymerase